MKAIQGIMLLTIMLAVSCSNEPGKDETVPPTAEQIFVNTINGKFVWNSDGTELPALTNADGSGTLGYDYNFHSLVEGSTTQAIYEGSYGNAFIGVELFNDNTEAVMYKKDTVEEWTISTDVNFAPEHKLTSSAKGEWIASAKSKTISIDSTEYTMKNDGHLYLADVLTFTHVSTTQPVARTPHDGFLRDRSIYKKADAEEYLGLLADDTEHLSVYKDAMINYWITEDAVVFDDANKVDPLADFKKLIVGTYTGVYDINATSELELVALTIDADGNISKAGTLLYTLVSLKPGNKAIFSLQVDVPDPESRALVDKFIGFSFIEAGKMTLHRQGMKTVYDTAEAVVIDDTTWIEPVNIFKYSLPKGEIPVGAEVLTVKVDGHLYEGETIKYSFLELHTHVDYAGLQTTNAIYTDTANKFFGIQVDTLEAKIYPYRNGKTSPWDDKASVSFGSEHKVSAPDTWDSVGRGLSPDVIHWPSAVIDNDGNVVLAYQDNNKLSVQRYDKATALWTSIADKIHDAWGPSIAKDSAGNLYSSYESDGQGLAVSKWVKDSGAWENMGTGADRLITGLKGQKTSLAVDKDDNIYLLHKKGRNSTEGSSVRKYNSSAKTWDLVGPADAIKGAGTKKIIATSTGELWVVSSQGANGSELGQLVVQRYNTTDATWDTVGGAADTGYIAASYNITIGVNSLNEIYVAYDATSDRKATILKLNTTKDGWDTIGTGVGAKANYISIAFYNDGAPLVGSSGAAATVNPGPIEVMKYDGGTAWSKVGKDAQVSAGNAFYPGIVVDTSTDTTYAAYSDVTVNGGGLSVRQHQRVQ